jgi:hypothetical protein
MWTQFMSKRIIAAGLIAMALSSASAFASPLCLKHHQSFALNADTVTLSMTMKAGQDCIQGLRRSYMQIYAVQVIEAPKQGKLSVVGSGFRYAASDDSRTLGDQFTIAIVGKNRNIPGTSVVRVVINDTEDQPYSPAPSKLSSDMSLSSIPTLPILL